MVDNTTIASLALGDLVSSDLLSAALLSLDEQENQPSTLITSSNEGTSQLPRHPQLMQLNSVKVCFLVAKSVAATFEDESSINACALKPEDIQIQMRTAGQEDIMEQSSGTNRYILLDTELVPSADNAASAFKNSGDLSPLQNLSVILHTILSRGKSEQLSTMMSKERRVSDISVSSVPSRSTKSSRLYEDKSLFAQLLQTGEYPVSICRLLSDMMDSHHISAQDVIDDLQAMVSNPQLYLYDQPLEFYSTIMFGKGYYGQVSEMTKMLQVANRTTGEVVDSRIQEEEGGRKRGGGGGGGSISSNGVLVDVIFVSGIAGSGKSSLAKYAQRFLSNLGWIGIKAKLKRGAEHESWEIVCGLFDDLVKQIVVMGDERSNNSHVSYSRHACDVIFDALDLDGLATLKDVIPSISKMFPNEDLFGGMFGEAEISQSQLLFLLSKLVLAILSAGRNIVLVLDDIQWCESGMLELVSEILIAIGQSAEGGQHLLYLGLYRADEVGEDHAVLNQIDSLKKSPHVNIGAEITPASLTKEDVTEMLMTELRLPRRLVAKLAGVVFNRTLGHAMFVVQLLNELVNGRSIITFSPKRQRFDWNEDKLVHVKEFESIASLIVANLSSLDDKSEQALRVLACLLGQSELALLRLLDSSMDIAPRGGFEPCLRGLVDKGIIESTEKVVSFTHDLIQQQVYDSIPKHERHQLHYDIGTFLGDTDNLDEKDSLESILDNLDLTSDMSEPCCSGRELFTSSLGSVIFIATEQINLAGPQFIRDHANRVRFAQWNLYAGKKAAEHSSFQIAANHYVKGIEFLQDDAWKPDTRRLCQDLTEGAANSFFALGNLILSQQHAVQIIENVQFEDSIKAQFILIRSFNGSFRHSEAIARGIAVFRTLGIDIPTSPGPATMIGAMKGTSKLLSQYSVDQIVDMAQTESIDSRTRNIVKISEALMFSCYRESSPYLPLFACAMINFTLENKKACKESAIAYVAYGNFVLTISEDFRQAKKAVDIALRLGPSPFAQMALHGYLNMWFVPHKEVSNHQLKIYDEGMKLGDVDTATYSLCLHYRFLFFAGEKLSIVSKGYSKALNTIAKYSKEVLMFAALDNVLIDNLTGVDSSPFAAMQGMEIKDETQLLTTMKRRNHHQSLVTIYSNRFMSAFWRGNYREANKYFDLAVSLPSYKLPKIQLMYSTFFRGLVLFQSYRDGAGEDCFEEGKLILDKVRRWEANCKEMFENKVVLLEAEYYASNCNIVAAMESYELAAELARGNGFVHEQGLSYELYGKFLSSVAEIVEATKYFHEAHDCYRIWGANAKADEVWKEHNLAAGQVNYVARTNKKHDRED